MRGEDRNLDHGETRGLGSPPHARGGLDPLRAVGVVGWITPACAGRTGRGRGPGSGPTDHPRMRGEDDERQFNINPGGGSPPHARGGHPHIDLVARLDRITPACAGRTVWPDNATRILSDHPRMRGEDILAAVRVLLSSGSPPHARGGPRPTRRCGRRNRITPACAGRTRTAAEMYGIDSDHPRMRGEDEEPRPEAGPLEGSPPHARGGLRRVGQHQQRGRITPACAGRTCAVRRVCSGPSDHPRMRGEDTVPYGLYRGCLGSPPHARGGRVGGVGAGPEWGITPACAGRTLPDLGR